VPSDTSRILEPLIRRAVDRGKPVGLPPNPYGGGIVGHVVRTFADAIGDDLALHVWSGRPLRESREPSRGGMLIVRSTFKVAE